MPCKTKELQREYCRVWIHERRRKFFSDKECLLCGSYHDLELHHRDPKEKESHNIWSWSIKRQEVEIKKCIILCTLCHDMIHICERRNVDHGSSYWYETVGCRCEKCRQWNMDRVRRQRAGMPWKVQDGPCKPDNAVSIQLPAPFFPGSLTVKHRALNPYLQVRALPREPII